ncbi:MAG TPA: hypothetical protein GXZ90_05100 [Clostridiales bacterium]|nr:hypothetical protein [Clostridiales bacterium]
MTDASNFINFIDKTELQTILLSGSIARGDFYPGKFGGMIDLIVMKNNGSTLTPESLFGKDEEPDIPYHCITVNKTHFQILFIDFIDYKAFQSFDEPRKFAFLESKILWDRDNKYNNELQIIEKYARIDQNKQLASCLGYINYLLSDYKKDRWYRREAFTQMHENLNTSIRLMIQCLYYINNSYSPAEDRRLYYSYTLKKLPQNYEVNINELFKQDILSEADYSRREKMFNSIFMEFVNHNRPTTAST